MRKKVDKSLYKNYTINNINLDKFDEILNDYITILNKELYYQLLRCEFVLEFDKKF